MEKPKLVVYREFGVIFRVGMCDNYTLICHELGIVRTCQSRYKALTFPECVECLTSGSEEMYEFTVVA